MLWSVLVALGVAAVGTALVASALRLGRGAKVPGLSRVGRARLWPATLPPPRAGRQVWVVPRHRDALLRLLAQYTVDEGPVLLVTDQALAGPQLFRGEAPPALPGRPLVLADRPVDFPETATLMVLESGQGMTFTADDEGLLLEGRRVFTLDSGELRFA